jgi:hypothetical protein
MGLQIGIFFIVNVFVVVRAEMARVMLLAQVIKESHVVEEEFLAKIAVGMRQYLSMSIVA